MKKNNTSYNSDCYINRELSWLEFNQRVLEEACDSKYNPLLERLKFTSIVSSNLDEFFMIRVASLYDQIYAGFNKSDLAGMNPNEQILKISERVHQMVEEQYSCLNNQLLKKLRKEGIHFLSPSKINEEQKDFIYNYFNSNVYPVLTPMVSDQSRPFPLVLNKSLNIALLLKSSEDPSETIFGTVQVPSVLERIVEVPAAKGSKHFILLEDVIKMHINTLFTGHEILTMSCYRITRNADQGLEEEGAEDLLKAIEQFLKKRKWGRVVRLEVEKQTDESMIRFLADEFELPSEGLYYINGPLDLIFLMKISSINGFDNLKYPVSFPQPVPAFTKYNNVFEAISNEDILVHHPYESFDPVSELVRKAAVDPEVLAIKQTLYRVSGNSPVVEALAQAAENGKQVTVLVELKARFDEENNILWAKRLEMAGCHVIYGLVGLKTHCKLLLVVRNEQGKIKRYVHMGTGNYNDVTARLYTDIGLFSSNHYYGSDVSAIFNMLSGYSKPTKLFKLTIAPLTLREKFYDLIDDEIKNGLEGREAKIEVKINSLVDKGIIDKLYDASCAGVTVNLIVRGICCLKPGIKDVSENIRVTSIVGRYLEHSRIFCFYNGGNELMFMSSADWMNRNLDRRVELLFPVEDSVLRAKLRHIINLSFQDNIKARVMNSDGTYSLKKSTNSEKINSQEYFMTQALFNAKNLVDDDEVFKPNMSY